MYTYVLVFLQSVVHKYHASTVAPTTYFDLRCSHPPSARVPSCFRNRTAPPKDYSMRTPTLPPLDTLAPGHLSAKNAKATNGQTAVPAYMEQNHHLLYIRPPPLLATKSRTATNVHSRTPTKHRQNKTSHASDHSWVQPTLLMTTRTAGKTSSPPHKERQIDQTYIEVLSYQDRLIKPRRRYDKYVPCTADSGNWGVEQKYMHTTHKTEHQARAFATKKKKSKMATTTPLPREHQGDRRTFVC